MLMLSLPACHVNLRYANFTDGNQSLYNIEKDYSYS